MNQQTTSPLLLDWTLIFTCFAQPWFGIATWIRPDTDVNFEVLLALQEYYHTNCVYLLYKSFPNVGLWRQLSERQVPAQMLRLEEVDPEKLATRCANSRPLVVVLSLDDESVRVLRQVSHTRWLSAARWLLFARNLSLQQTLGDVYIPFDCELLVAEVPPVRGSNVTLVEVYRSGWSTPLRVLPWGRWNPSQGLTGPTLSLSQRRRDLEGAQLRAVIKHYYPLLLVQSRNYGVSPAGGYFGEVWAVLETSLNCSTQYFGPPDDEWGSRLENGSWSGILGVIQRGEADVALSGYILMSEKAEVVDFSQPLLRSGTYLFLRSMSLKLTPLSGFLRPFSSDLWLTILVSIPIAVTWLWIILYLDSYPTTRPPTTRSELLSQSVHTVTGIFCVQSVGATSQSRSYKVLLWTLYLTAIVITTAYSSSLVAFLSVRKFTLPFTTFKGLLNDGSHQLGVLSQSSQMRILKGSKDLVLATVYDRLVQPHLHELPLTENQAVSNICSRQRYVYFGTELIIRSSLANLSCAVVKLPKTKVDVAIGLLHPKRNPYRSVIAKGLTQLRQAGILHLLGGRDKPIYKTKPSSHSHTQVDLFMVASYFLLLAIGVLMGVIFLAAEVTYHGAVTRTRRRCPKQLTSQRHSKYRTTAMLETRIKKLVTGYDDRSKRFGLEHHH